MVEVVDDQAEEAVLVVADQAEVVPEVVADQAEDTEKVVLEVVSAGDLKISSFKWVKKSPR
jgi:hypothetical protein